MPKPPIKTKAGAASPGSPVVLGSNKLSVDALLGSSVMARSLLGMTAQGEKAYGYPQPADDIVVGFFDGVARYLAVIRSKGPKTGFSPAEMSSILALNGPPNLWKSEQVPGTTAKPSKGGSKPTQDGSPTTYYSFSDKDRQIIGWQPGDKPFVFFLLPSYPGQPSIVLNEWQVEAAIG